MKKLLFLTALALIGCDNYTPNQEPKVIEKKVIVHDTITKYMTHECSKEYGVEATEVNGNTYVFEIHNKRTDEIVFYLQPMVIWNQITKAGGKTRIAESDMCKHWKDQHIIGCYVQARVKGKNISFSKEWPDSEFYLVETYSIGVSPAVNTLNFLPPPKDNWD